MSTNMVFDGKAIFDAEGAAGEKFSGTLEIKLPPNPKLLWKGKPVFTEDLVPMVILMGVQYTAPGFEDVKGMGMMMITAPNADQKAKKLKIAGNAVIVAGSEFDAQFTPMVPAMLNTPNGPVPHPPAPATLKGKLDTPNDKHITA